MRKLPQHFRNKDYTSPLVTARDKQTVFMHRTNVAGIEMALELLRQCIAVRMHNNSIGAIGNLVARMEQFGVAMTSSNERVGAKPPILSRARLDQAAHELEQKKVYAPSLPMSWIERTSLFSL